MITIDGLVTGIDTEAIVQGLLEVQQQQLDRLELKRTDVLAEQGVFRSLEAQILTFRADVGRLARIQGNPLLRQSVAVSDEQAVAASASPSAIAGVYRLTVESQARAHQVASQGFADADSEITHGTLDLRLGAGDVHTITIDSSNDTLQGLADAVNELDSGVTATIVQDSSLGATPNRLLLTASKTGTDNAIVLTNNLTTSSGSAVRPDFDFGNPVQAASNASVTLGEGAGAITVESSTNRFDSLIAGVTVDLLQADQGQEITITVARDAESGTEAVQNFVDSFNSVMEFIDSRSAYDPVAESGGVLLGNRTAINIQQRLRTAILNAVPGVNTNANRLSTIGITVNDQGRLQLNSNRISEILSGADDTISAADVQRLFSLDAESSHPGVSFILGSSRTQPSSDPYQVDITQAAEQATLTADSPLGASTVIDDSNRTIHLSVDGAETTVTLETGTYDRQQLADHIETVLNAASDLQGRSVRVGLTGDQLTLTSESYGSSSSLRFIGGTALATLGLSAGATDVGRDVAGSFLVNGQVESATGSGRLLSGDVDNENTADLQLRISLDPSQVVAGPEANLDVTRGLAATLDALLGDLLDTETGGLAIADDRYDAELESIATAVERQQALFDQQQEALVRQFVALESSISELQATSSFLGTQLAGLSNLRPQGN